MGIGTSFNITGIASALSDIDNGVGSFFKGGSSNPLSVLGGALNTKSGKVGTNFGSILGFNLGGDFAPTDNTDVYNTSGSTGSDGAYSTAVREQTQSVGADKAAFRWVEKFVTPDMFATPDSCLVGYGEPIRGANDAGSNFNLIGFCQNFTVNTGNNVVTFKELRNESTIVIPTKSLPGTISITRLLGYMPDFISTVSKGTKWSMDPQSKRFKKLFGLVLIFMSPSRKDTFCTLYAERCAVQSATVQVQAGQMEMAQSIQIAFGRLLDDSTGGETATSAGTTPTLTSSLPTSKAVEDVSDYYFGENLLSGSLGVNIDPSHILGTPVTLPNGSSVPDYVVLKANGDSRWQDAYNIASINNWSTKKQQIYSANLKL